MELHHRLRTECEVFQSMSLLMTALDCATQALAEFTPFPRLPIELRLKILQYSLLRPRIVDLSWSSRLGRCVSSGGPAILQVSMEAREIGLKIFHPSFGTTSDSPVYFDFDRDIARIRWESLGLAPGRLIGMTADCRRVKTLEIHIEDLNRLMEHGIELTKFESLEELRVSGCRRSLPYNVGYLHLSGREVNSCLRDNLLSPVLRGRFLPPKLKCLGLGARCRYHWWFSVWNELCTQKLLSWPFKYSSVSTQACRILASAEMQFDLNESQGLDGRN